MKTSLLFFLAIFCFLIPARAQEKPASVDSTAINKAAIERDGSSYDKAIIILKKTEEAGGKAEYSWLRDKYPGYRTHSQSLNFHNQKPYDIINIRTQDGKDVAVYFDISNFFGKL